MPLKSVFQKKTEGFQSAKDSKQTTHKGVLQRTEDRIESITDSSVYEYTSNFVSNNASQVASIAAEVEPTQAFQDIKDTLQRVVVEDFDNYAKFLIKALKEIEKFHPAIKAGLLAFRFVINLEIVRRDNNKKVLLLKLEMQKMMELLLRLKPVKDSELVGKDGKPRKKFLEERMKMIGEDIMKCGTMCKTYLEKSFLRKLLKSLAYDERLGEYIKIFNEHYKELDKLLTVHMVLGVNQANRKLDELSARMEAVFKSLDKLAKNSDVTRILQQLDTDKEKSLRNYIEKHGGAKVCIEKDSILEDLILQTGETFTEIPGKIVPGKSSSQSKEALMFARSSLRKELAEDIDELLRRHQNYLDTKFEDQQRQLSDSIIYQGDRIIKAVSSGAVEQIQDKELKAIWKEMGWKACVKARDFVFAVREYLLDEIHQLSTFSQASKQGEISGDVRDDAPPLQDFPPAEALEWIRSYINVVHLQPLLENIDDDASGYVNINEVNNFVRERPPKWTLLEWLSYWAVGWQLNITGYRTAIYLLLKDIYTLKENVMWNNRQTINEYFKLPGIQRLEALLRSTTPVSPRTEMRPRLIKLASMFAQREQKQLEKILEELSYTVYSTSIFSSISHSGSIEKHVYPLFFIIIKHHKSILSRGVYERISPYVVYKWGGTFDAIFEAMFDRLKWLEAIFQHSEQDRETQLSHFAFGMFQTFSDNQYEIDLPTNTLLEVWDSMVHAKASLNHQLDNDDQSMPATDHTLTSLKSPIESCQNTSVTRPSVGSAGVLLGKWFGRCFSDSTERPQDQSIASKWGFFELDITQINSPSQFGGTLRFTILENEEDMVGVSDPEYEIHNVEGSLTWSESCGCCNSPRWKLAATVTGRFRRLISMERLRYLGHFDETMEFLSGSWSLDVIDSDEGEDEELDLEKEVDPAEGEKYENENEKGKSQEGQHKGKGEYRNTPEERDTYQESMVEDGQHAEGHIEEDVGGKGQEEEESGDREGEPKKGYGESDLGEEYTEHHARVLKISEGIFYLSRIPEDLAYLRHTPETFFPVSSQLSPRWKLLTAAAFCIGQFRLKSMQIVRRWAIKRTRFLDLRSRQLSGMYSDGMDYRPLSSEETAEFNDLRNSTPPGYLKPYESIFIGHVNHHIYCNGRDCPNKNIRLRFICIACVRKDLTDQFDFCFDCINLNGFENHSRGTLQFTSKHNLSHSLICTAYELEKFELAWLLPRAQELSKNTKQAFQRILKIEKAAVEKRPDPEDTTEDVEDGEDEEDVMPDSSSAFGDGTPYTTWLLRNALGHCSLCKEPVSKPFWICLICSYMDYDNLICDGCFRQKEVPSMRSLLWNPRSDGHWNSIYSHHIWMRIWDETAFETEDDEEEPLGRLERRLGNVEQQLGRMEERLTDLMQHLFKFSAIAETSR